MKQKTIILKFDMKELRRHADIDEYVERAYKSAPPVALSWSVGDLQDMIKAVEDITSLFRERERTLFVGKPVSRETIYLYSCEERHSFSRGPVPLRDAFSQIKDSIVFLNIYGSLGVEYTLSLGVPPTLILDYTGKLHIKNDRVLFSETERSVDTLVRSGRFVFATRNALKVTYESVARIGG